MKHPFLFLLCASIACGCVEQTDKYKQLQAQLDSVQVAAAAQNAEFEEVFATINEIEKGLKSIRETENLLQIQSATGGELTISAREQIKNDIQFIAAAIEEYKSKITRLEKEQKAQSAQFQKRLKTITQELESKQKLIEDLSHQLDEKERQLTIKTQQIVSMDQSIATLKADLTSMERERERQVVKMGEQDRRIYSGYYIIGNKSELITSKVLSKGGLFRAAKVSYQAEQSAFNEIDIRIVTSIPLNAKKGKVLSIHPAGSYYLGSNAQEALTLQIINPALFWEHTKYLVIKID